MGLNAVLAHEQKTADPYLHELKRIATAIPSPRSPTPSSFSPSTPKLEKSDSASPTEPVSLLSPRFGGAESFSFSRNGGRYVEPTRSQRCYRIVGYKTGDSGNAVIDILDGTEYACGHGMEPKISKDVVVYDTKEAALSERFPSNQVGRARSGNGRYPRALVSFDCWGYNRRRLGGGQSNLFEYAKFVAIIQTLDAPFPVPKQRSKTSVAPHYFAPVDFTHPPRERFDSFSRKEKKFSPKMHY